MSVGAELRARVDALYRRNRQQGRAAWCDRDYDFVCPSTGTYPFQWFWDSCFHAVVLSHLDGERAQAEIRSLLAHQGDDGMISHVTFWERERHQALLATYGIAYKTPYLSDCIQPPLLAEAVAAVAERGGGAAFVREVLPAVRRYYHWLDRVRDPDRDGLIATVQADESGLDHSPKYDAYLGVRAATHAECDAAWRRVHDAHAEVKRDPAQMFARGTFVCEDVLVNTIYAENQRVLGELCADAGDADGAAAFAARAEKTRASLLGKCWDPEARLFFDLCGADEEPQRVSTVSSLMPLLLAELPADVAAQLTARLEDPADYGTAFPAPSVSPREPSYVPGPCDGTLVWRGPTWINTNWYLARGLRRHGRTRPAERLEERSLELVTRGGFREYYHPHTGEGHGAHDFSWSALVLDMLETR